jgi:hypothetical protein
LLTTASHRALQDDDRGFLVRLASARTGLAQPDAERRVDDVASKARDDINRARRSAVLIAFAAGVAALLGAAVAWVAACAGGRDRDGTGTRTALYEMVASAVFTAHLSSRCHAEKAGTRHARQEKSATESRRSAVVQREAMRGTGEFALAE